ncbi:MAG: aspartate dehydrogenase [Pseudomonadota bacterium]
MARVAIIGRGAIGTALAPLLEADGHTILPVGRNALQQALDWKPDVAVEAAGHAALGEYGPAVLQRGIPLIAASVGALADDELHEALLAAARHGKTQLHLPSGAIAGIDALAALPGPVTVEYTGTKPTHAWPTGTQDGTFFEGSARDAARLYPKNANVAATLALASSGLDETRVRLIADPKATGNSHAWRASGGGSEIAVSVSNQPTPDNPGSSALTVHSLRRTVRNLTTVLSI